MKRQIFFCKSWFRAKKKPIEIWSADQAQAAHDAGQTYTVLVDSMDRPSCFLEITKEFVGVCFLDDSLRENLNYQFREVSLGELFLTMATYREFDENSDHVKSGTSYMFEQNGEIKIRRESFSPESSLDVSSSQTDVSFNYEPFPFFGEYDSLIRIERS